MWISEQLALDILLAIVLPAVVGIVLARWAGDAARRHGWPPLRVHSLRVTITCIWVAIVVGGSAVTLSSYSILSALTLSAIAGVAITLALQTTLQNIIAGFILIRNRFLHLGDQVQFSGVKGTVVGLGLIEVVIRTDTGALAMVSNANLLSGPLINLTASTRLSGEY